MDTSSETAMAGSLNTGKTMMEEVDGDEKKQQQEEEEEGEENWRRRR